MSCRCIGTDQQVHVQNLMYMHRSDGAHCQHADVSAKIRRYRCTMSYTCHDIGTSRCTYRCICTLASENLAFPLLDLESVRQLRSKEIAAMGKSDEGASKPSKFRCCDSPYLQHTTSERPRRIPVRIFTLSDTGAGSGFCANRLARYHYNIFHDITSVRDLPINTRTPGKLHVQNNFIAHHKLVMGGRRYHLEKPNHDHGWLQQSLCGLG